MKRQMLVAVMILAIVLSTYIKAEATEKIPLSEEIQLICWDVGREFDICPTVLMSLIWQESRGKKKNLTQITNLKWFEEGIEELELTNVKKNSYANIRLCGYYLHKWCVETEDMGYALMCWNEGETNVSKNLTKYSYYANSIMERSAEWEEIFYEADRRNHP